MYTDKMHTHIYIGRVGAWLVGQGHQPAYLRTRTTTRTRSDCTLKAISVLCCLFPPSLPGGLAVCGSGWLRWQFPGVLLGWLASRALRFC